VGTGNSNCRGFRLAIVEPAFVVGDGDGWLRASSRSLTDEGSPNQDPKVDAACFTL